jgi:hypothetical protein
VVAAEAGAAVVVVVVVASVIGKPAGHAARRAAVAAVDDPPIIQPEYAEVSMNISVERYHGCKIVVRKQEKGDAWQASITDDTGFSVDTGLYAVKGEALAEARVIVDHRSTLKR